MNSTTHDQVDPPITVDSGIESNRAFISCDDAAAYLHESLKERRGTEFVGYILQNENDHFFYVAKEADLKKAPTLSLVVTVSLSGELAIPAGYTIEARLISHAPGEKGHQESNVEWGQRKRFFKVSDLFGVMTHRRRFSRCYLSLSDNGLLSYTSIGSAFERELSSTLARKTDGTLQLFESLYERGAVPSNILILLAVTAGEVTTVVPGSLWRRRGKLKASWRDDVLAQNPPIELLPICGPICKDGKEVAQFINSRMSKLSPEHVGLVLKHRTQKLFVVTDPILSDYANFSRMALFPKDVHGNPLIPAELRVHGFFHSAKPVPASKLPSTEVERYKNFFSPADLKVGLDRILVSPLHRLFLYAPDGAVLRFAYADNGKVDELRQLLAPETDSQQSLEQQIISGALSVQAYIDQVATVGELTVLFPSASWPVTGRVDAHVAGESVDPEAQQ
ncbi:hypothetical protein ACQKP5_20150 [Pseudomonas vancouverensis]|uniref:hypothetical protein n=1 Tax=Pseudomonas vancouverensis TaxID=95300 RepID=UPI003D08DAC5